MITFTILLLVFLIVFIISFNFIGENTMMVYPIKGVMFGILYNDEKIEEEEIKEHTLQICMYLVCFTFIWETDLKK